MWDAIVLAGGEPEPGLDPGVLNKAFVEVAGLPLVGHVVAALQQARGIGRIAVVGPSALEQVLPDGLVVVPDAGGIMDNVVRAARALDGAGSMLVAAADVPLL